MNSGNGAQRWIGLNGIALLSVKNVNLLRIKLIEL